MSPFQLIVVPALSAVVLWMAVRTFRHDVPGAPAPCGPQSGPLRTRLSPCRQPLLLSRHGSESVVVRTWCCMGRRSQASEYHWYFYNRYRRLEEIVTVLVRREALRNARRGNAATDRVTVGLADSN